MLELDLKNVEKPFCLYVVVRCRDVADRLQIKLRAAGQGIIKLLI